MISQAFRTYYPHMLLASALAIVVALGMSTAPEGSVGGNVYRWVLNPVATCLYGAVLARTLWCLVVKHRGWGRVGWIVVLLLSTPVLAPYVYFLANRGRATGT